MTTWPMARRLAAEEGLFTGTSADLNVVGAIDIALELGTGKTVVTVACDIGLKYLASRSLLLIERTRELAQEGSGLALRPVERGEILDRCDDLV